MLLHYLSLPHKHAILSAILHIEMNFVHCFASFLQIFSLFVSPSLSRPLFTNSHSLFLDLIRRSDKSFAYIRNEASESSKFKLFTL